MPSSTDDDAPCGWSDTVLSAVWGQVPPSFPPEGPYLLLDDARDCGAGFLFHAPRRLIVAHRPGEIGPALAEIEAEVARGHYAAGALAYEAGEAFEPLAADDRACDEPLLWFGVFDAPARIDDCARWLGAPATGPIPFAPAIDEASYRAAAETVLAYIEAGDIYQANLTFPCHAELGDTPAAHYARLRRAQQAGWGALLSCGERTVLSLSPELMVAAGDGRSAWAKPMKGTAPRGTDAAGDAAAAARLGANEKDRAENLMIVDLIRNDLSQVAEAGSVRVPALFAVEAYPTLFQMTSTVRARLRPGCGAAELLRAMLPCGSITGAPKIRARQVIAELESGPRGLYTGAIGFVAPGGACAFNVAIRTIVVPAGARRGTLGLGSGITAGSDPAAEWAECLAKAAFLQAGLAKERNPA